jgi:hypothetical protein
MGKEPRMPVRCSLLVASLIAPLIILEAGPACAQTRGWVQFGTLSTEPVAAAPAIVQASAVQPAPARPDVGASEQLPAPAQVLAQLAIEGNRTFPCCDPPGPTHGIWGPDGCPSHPRSWQEWIGCFRDCLGWIFTRPVCYGGARPPSDASLWDWTMQWLPRTSSSP